MPSGPLTESSSLYVDPLHHIVLNFSPIFWLVSRSLLIGMRVSLSFRKRSLCDFDAYDNIYRSIRLITMAEWRSRTRMISCRISRSNHRQLDDWVVRGARTLTGRSLMAFSFHFLAPVHERSFKITCDHRLHRLIEIHFGQATMTPSDLGGRFKVASESRIIFPNWERQAGESATTYRL